MEGGRNGWLGPRARGGGLEGGLCTMGRSHGKREGGKRLK